MIHENTEVLILGFPDPYEDNYNDYIQQCALKDSLWKMDKYLNELNLSDHERLGYQFSVLLVGDDEDYTLIYSYCGNKKIEVREEFEGILHFTPQLKVEVHKRMLS